MILQNTLDSIRKGTCSVEVFGLGYIGFPLAVRLANSEMNVLGIDVSAERIERLSNNNLMDSEIHLKEDFEKSRKDGNLELSTTSQNSEFPKIGIICVPTPIPSNTIKSDVFVRSAVQKFLKKSKKGDIIILESSIEVGTTENMIKIIEENNFTVGESIGLCFCPERIDPANKEWGIENIPRVIYCSDDTSFEIAKKIYQNVNGANLIRVSSPKVAEVVKSFENAFRLVNISLVNELAILCDKLRINVNEVINAASTKPFGFMAHYPGAGAGGHCIPKDPRFLLESAKKLGISFETIENALKINSLMPSYICDSIEKSIEKMKLGKNVLVCGLSYKVNVEDMRDSASFKIINEFKKRNFTVKGYDPFFKSELIEKYAIENNLKKVEFSVLNTLDDENLKNLDCMCLVQHHDQDKNRYQEIYNNSLVPFIYDCQNKISRNLKSKTILNYLGA